MDCMMVLFAPIWKRFSLMFPYVFRIRSTILTVFHRISWKKSSTVGRMIFTVVDFYGTICFLLTLTKLLLQQLSFLCFRIYTVCISHSPSLSKVWKLESSRGQDLDFSTFISLVVTARLLPLHSFTLPGIQKWHGFQIHISNLDLSSTHLTYLKICLALNNIF